MNIDSVDRKKLNFWIERRDASVTGLFAIKGSLIPGYERWKEYVQVHGRTMKWFEFPLELLRIGNHNCGDYTPIAMDIAQNCPMLTKLNAANCLENDDGILAIVENCPLLEFFSVVNCSNQVVLKLAECGKNLKTVSLAFADVDEESLLALVRNCPKIELFITDATGVTDKFLCELVRSCRNLGDLLLSRVKLSRNALYFLLQHATNLFALLLESTHLHGQMDYSHTMTKSVSMRSLTLHDVNITSYDLHDLICVCPHLTKLDVTHCKTLTRVCCLPIGAHCTSLETLIIRDCGSCAVNDSLLDIAAHCPHMRKVLIPDSLLHAGAECGLTRVAMHCPLLEVLDISGAEGVTEGAVFALALHARNLKELQLRYCEQITDLSVAALMEGCPKLTELDVYYCGGVSEKMQDAVEERYYKTKKG
jgi:hypothetical protein